MGTEHGYRGVNLAAGREVKRVACLRWWKGKDDVGLVKLSDGFQLLRKCADHLVDGYHASETPLPERANGKTRHRRARAELYLGRARRHRLLQPLPLRDTAVERSLYNALHEL